MIGAPEVLPYHGALYVRSTLFMSGFRTSRYIYTEDAPSLHEKRAAERAFRDDEEQSAFPRAAVALLLGEEAEPHRDAHVVRAVRDAELFVHALLVCIDGFRADRKSLTDFWSGISARDEHQHLALTFGKTIESRAFFASRILGEKAAGEHMSGVLLHVHLAASDCANRVYELAIRCTLDEVAGSARLEHRE